MTDKNRIVLARGIVEQATKDKKCSLPAAKLCAIIMEVMYIYIYWIILDDLSLGLIYNNIFYFNYITERKKWSLLRLLLEYMSDVV